MITKNIKRNIKFRTLNRFAFRCFFYRASDKLHLECKKEVEVLENIINKKVNIVSFHRPSEKILNMNSKIGGLEHTYMNKFIDDIFYCSDSEGRWRYSKPFNIINENRTKKTYITFIAASYLVDNV